MEQIATLVNIHHLGIEDKDYIFIGRNGTNESFGNPFKIPEQGNRKEVCRLYDQWLRGKMFIGFNQAQRQWILDNLFILKNKRLGCFCSPKQCHGEVLIKLLKEIEEHGRIL